MSTFRSFELTELKRRPPGAALSLKMLVRRQTGPLLVLYDARPPNRIVMQEYQVSPVSLTQVTPLTGPTRVIEAPVFWRYLRIAELQEGTWNLKLYGPSTCEDVIDVVLDVAPGETGIYEIAFATHNWYPFLKPKSLEHRVYHGWRPLSKQ